LAAQRGGAFRVELCENLNEGGTTPSYGQLKLARKLLNIKLHVLIRPRPGDFLYTDLEFDVMKEDVAHCAETGCDGVVIGMLKADGSIDKPRCLILAQMAQQAGLQVTFHRAFDMCADMHQALHDIIDMGIERILTSGGRATAIEGAATIRHLVDEAGGKTIIMPGSGVTEYNAADIVRFTGVREIHTSAKSSKKSAMNFFNEHIFMTKHPQNEYIIEESDEERVKRILHVLNAE
jgi:copper homeostasis protein